MVSKRDNKKSAWAFVLGKFHHYYCFFDSLVLRRGTNLWEGKIHCGRRYRGGDVHCLNWISGVERIFILFRFS